MPYRAHIVAQPAPAQVREVVREVVPRVGDGVREEQRLLEVPAGEGRGVSVGGERKRGAEGKEREEGEEGEEGKRRGEERGGEERRRTPGSLSASGTASRAGA